MRIYPNCYNQSYYNQYQKNNYKKSEPKIPMLNSTEVLPTSNVSFNGIFNLSKFIKKIMSEPIDEFVHFNKEEYLKLSEAQKDKIRTQFNLIMENENDNLRLIGEINAYISDCVKTMFDKEFGEGKYVVLPIGRSLSTIGKSLGVRIGEENVVDIEINANYNGSTKKCLGMYIIDRQALISIIENAHSRGKKGYLMNLVLRNIGKLKIKGYKSKSFIRKINTINDYYRLNMEILNKNVRDILFNTNSRIYTKVKDMTPTKYLENSKVKNSFIADGCIIDGEVENSIIFRGVVINRGSVIKNSIIMQQSEIQNNTHLENVILDKRVLIRENKTLIGTEDFPIVVSKGKVI